MSEEILSAIESDKGLLMANAEMLKSNHELLSKIAAKLGVL